MLAAEERSATLKTEGLRQVGELQRQVEQLLGMRSGLTHALQRLSEDIAGAMAASPRRPGDGDRPPGRASRRALGRRAPRASRASRAPAPRLRARRASRAAAARSRPLRTAAATRTSPPRTNAQTPRPRSIGSYEPANAAGVLGAERERLPGDVELERLRRSARRRRGAPRARRGARPSRPAGGCPGRRARGPRARRRGRCPARRARSASAAAARARSAVRARAPRRGTDPPRSARAARAAYSCTRALVLLVGRQPVRGHLPLAERLLQVRVETIALDRQRADERLQTSTSSRASSSPSSCSRQACTRSRHRRRASVSATMRARTSGERFVSCVYVVSRCSGNRSARSRSRAWNSSTPSAEAAGVAADLVQRGEAEVAVERRVLDALRHHRPGRLLEADDELLVAAAPAGRGCGAAPRRRSRGRSPRGPPPRPRPRPGRM